VHASEGRGAGFEILRGARITGQAEKIEQLQLHKKGLMQWAKSITNYESSITNLQLRREIAIRNF